MALQLTTDPQIDTYISKVIGDANHHAPEVQAIIKPLSDAVRSRLKLGTDKIEVYQRNGNMARTCWIVLGGKRYVFTFNYDDRKIDLKPRSLRGQSQYQFDNNTTPADLLNQVAAL